MSKSKIAAALGVFTLFALLAWLPVAPLVSEDAPAKDAEPSAQVTYEKKCGMCHGKDGVAKPMAQGSANLNDPEWQKTTSVEAIVKITTEGKDKMPKYAEKLTAAEIDAVAKYILTLR